MQNVLGFRHQHAAYLVFVNRPRKNILGRKNGLVTGLGQLDAAGLTTMADLHLRFDDIRITDQFGRFSHLMRVLGEYGFRRRNPLLLEQFPGLILIEIHEFFPLMTMIYKECCAIRQAL